MDLAQHSTEKAIQLRLVAAPPALIVEIEQNVAAAANAPVASAAPPVASDARAQEKAAVAAAAAGQGTSHDAIKRSICCTSELQEILLHHEYECCLMSWLLPDCWLHCWVSWP